MSKLLCVFSTLAASNEYVDWAQAVPGSAPTPRSSVIIKGGAGLPGKENIVTPRGVATMITEAQAEFLRNNSSFKLHEKNGFVTIGEVDRPPGEDAVEAAVANMEGRDRSAPLVPQDFTLAGQEPPKVVDAEPLRHDKPRK